MKRRVALPGQVVLVLQGGGALGAYQAGVYQALHDAGIEPDWVIGTSIGAINAALIAGNEVPQRMERMTAFWRRMEHRGGQLGAIMGGIPAFFTPNYAAWWSPHAALGAEAAGYYVTSPLRETLQGLVDPAHIASQRTRITVGAVNARSGEMRYFDSRRETVTLDHVIASGALPPAFPAVRIDGEPYWDGGIYSNTPIEAVLDDYPRRDSLIFAVHMWDPRGPEPETMWEVLGRQKDIQYASRAVSHIARQKELHQLRHVIREMAKRLPAKVRESSEMRELAAWGCGTTMHVARLVAPQLEGEDHTKDIDFTPEGIAARWDAGLQHTRRMLARAPWRKPVDPIDGVLLHDLAAA